MHPEPQVQNKMTSFASVRSFTPIKTILSLSNLSAKITPKPLFQKVVSHKKFSLDNSSMDTVSIRDRFENNGMMNNLTLKLEEKSGTNRVYVGPINSDT